MATTDEMKAALDELLKSDTAFKAEYQSRLDKIEAKFNRQALGLGGATPEMSGAWSSTSEGKAFETFLRSGEFDRKAMSLSTDPDGGYTAPPQFADGIVSVSAEQGAIRNLARIYTPTTGDFHQPISTTLAGAGRTTETGTRANTTTPSLADFHPVPGGLYAVAPLSNWLVNDSKYDVGAFVTQSIGEQFGVTESADFVSGDGVNKSRGFTTYTLAATADATRAWTQIEKLHAGSTTAFDIDDVIDLLAKLAPRYRKRACFCMHPDTEAYARKLKASTSGDYYWQPSVAAGAPNTLLGLPCCIDVNMPTIASAAAVIAVADWQRFYGITDVGQPTLLRDPYTSKGNTLFYVEKRLGGGVIDFNAGKLLVMST